MKIRRIIVLLIAILFILPSFAAARYYNPQTGRYLTPDPIGLQGGINPYVYVENDPVNLIDPLGLYIGQLPPPPPGYNPNTWPACLIPSSNGWSWEIVDPETGQRWIAHPEDESHWRHWDDPNKRGPDKRWPRNSKKPWPNQKRPPYGEQSSCDPSADSPEWGPPSLSEYTTDPLLPFIFLPIPSPVPTVAVPGFNPMPAPVFP